MVQLAKLSTQSKIPEVARLRREIDALMRQVQSAVTTNESNITVNFNITVTTAGTGTDNRVVRWDGTGTQNIQDSGVTLDDSDNATGFATVTASSTVTAGAVTYTATDGAAGQALVTNGAGTTSFAAPAPAAHASTHENGGGDEINVDGLSGLLADAQTPLAHASTHISSGTDEIDGDQLDVDWNPSNYTPTVAPAEVTSVDHLTAHLAGIDSALGGAVTDHGALTGLGDDDHTQYLLADGSRNGGTAGTQTFDNNLVVSGDTELNGNLSAADGTIEVTSRFHHTAVGLYSGSVTTAILHVDTTLPGVVLRADKTAAANRSIFDWFDGTNRRWIWSHSSANAVELLRYAGSPGSLQDIPFSVSNSTGDVDMANALTAGGTVTAGAVTYTDTDGSNGQALVTNGAGVTSFAAPAPAAHASTHERAGSDEIDGDHLDIDFTPAVYTPSIAPAEAAHVDDLAAHLAGIDDELGAIAAAAITDHGALGGLGDDDHTQYLLADGSRNGGTAGTQTFENNLVVDGTARVNNVAGSASVNADDLVIGSTGGAGAHHGLTILSDDAGTCRVYMGDATSNVVAGWTYNHSIDLHAWYVAGAAEMLLTSAALSPNNVAGLNLGSASVPWGTGHFSSTVTAGAVTYTATDGSSGQVLTTNGAGSATFQDPATPMPPIVLNVANVERDGVGGIADDGTLTAASQGEWALGRQYLSFTNEESDAAHWSCYLPETYSGNGLTVTMYCAGSTGSATDADFDVVIERWTAGLDMDTDSYSAANTLTVTMDATADEGVSGSVTFTDGADMDSVAAGDPFRLRISRPSGDAYGGDVRVTMLVVEETA